MTRRIKIVSVGDEPSSCGTEKKGSGSSFASEIEPAPSFMAAGIDTDIFEADIQELGGERFWEAYWKPQLTYGGVSEGQSLAAIFAGLADEVFGKLREDVTRLQAHHLRMHEDEKNDIFGMIIFLLGVERGDASYDPIEHEGYEGAMTRFMQAMNLEAQRRERQ